jgi:hypothetical protein
MRRRYVLALVFATALIFALVGTAFGRYAIPYSDSESGVCIAFRSELEKGTGDRVPEIAKAYDEVCR